MHSPDALTDYNFNVHRSKFTFLQLIKMLLRHLLIIMYTCEWPEMLYLNKVTFCWQTRKVGMDPWDGMDRDPALTLFDLIYWWHNLSQGSV